MEVNTNKPTPEQWELAFKQAQFIMKLMDSDLDRAVEDSFKRHFAEQEVNEKEILP